MLKALPGFARIYHLKPWEVAGGPPWLSFEEQAEFIKQMSESGS